MQPDHYILMEIAAQQDGEGATIAVIRDGVDYRQKLSLTDAEMHEGLHRLISARLIQSDGNRYLIVKSMLASLPRTPSGQLSFRRRDWARLQKRLFEA